MVLGRGIFKRMDINNAGEKNGQIEKQGGYDGFGPKAESIEDVQRDKVKEPDRNPKKNIIGKNPMDFPIGHKKINKTTIVSPGLSDLAFVA